MVKEKERKFFKVNNLQSVVKSVFLHVYDFYFVQGKPLSYDDKGHLSAVYSHKDENELEITRCAFGCLLGPELIPNKWEGESITSLLSRFRIDGVHSVIQLRMEEQGFWPDSEDDVITYISILSHLQVAHDHAALVDSKEMFQASLQAMFTKANIVWPGG